jgi:hypothetical protein
MRTVRVALFVAALSFRFTPEYEPEPPKSTFL